MGQPNWSAVAAALAPVPWPQLSSPVDLSVWTDTRRMCAGVVGVSYLIAWATTSKVSVGSLESEKALRPEVPGESDLSRTRMAMTGPESSGGSQPLHAPKACCCTPNEPWHRFWPVELHAPTTAIEPRCCSQLMLIG